MQSEAKNMTRLFSASPGAIWNFIINNLYGCRIATGTYTGDGTVAQAITGIGFRPKYTKIWEHWTAPHNTETFIKIDQMDTDHAERQIRSAGGTDHYLDDDSLISLDADGFTVDDDGANQHPNVLNQPYDFICLG